MNGTNDTTDCHHFDLLCLDRHNKTDQAYTILMKYIFPNLYEWIYIALFSIVFIFGLIGNILVFYAVWSNVHLRNTTNFFLVNLSIADFLVLLVCLPPTVIHDIAQTWFLGDTMCKIITYLQCVSVLVSVVTLTAISIERYLAICRPLSFRGSRFRTAFAVLIIWILSLVSSCPYLVFMTSIHDDLVPSSIVLLTSCVSSDFNQEYIFQIFLMVTFFLIPFLIMTYTYIRIALCLWRSSTSGSVVLDSRSEAATIQSRARRRTARMLIVVVIVFFICYIPVYLSNIFRYAGLTNTTNQDVLALTTLTSHLLCYFNSAINPVIYNFMSEKFKKEFRVACKFCGLGPTHGRHGTLTANVKMDTVTEKLCSDRSIKRCPYQNSNEASEDSRFLR
ncbi:orexin receptor type 2-like isoform X1 [Mytilus edulis]|uniref:orexin receptor type 2-like isoform X1 n=1 Tax=Mytilus edulis TaxID=6550 RepID=UPI0039F069EC